MAPSTSGCEYRSSNSAAVLTNDASGRSRPLLASRVCQRRVSVRLTLVRCPALIAGYAGDKRVYCQSGPQVAVFVKICRCQTRPAGDDAPAPDGAAGNDGGRRHFRRIDKCPIYRRQIGVRFLKRDGDTSMDINPDGVVIAGHVNGFG